MAEASRSSVEPSRGRSRPLSALIWLVAVGLYLATDAPPTTPVDPQPDPRMPLTHLEIVAKLREVNPLLGRVREARVADAILRCQREHGLSPRTTLSIIIVESSARPHVRSPKGAVGLMQVMPHMWRDLGSAGNIVHIESNIEAGCTILAVPSLRDRIPVIVDRVTTLVGPGELVDVVVTERGIAINPRRQDLIDATQGSDLPISDIRGLQAEVEAICGGKPRRPERSDQPIAVVKWVDGTVLDTAWRVGNG